MASADPRENLVAMKGLVERYRKDVDWLSSELAAERARVEQLESTLSEQRQTVRLREAQIHRSQQQLAVQAQEADRRLKFEQMRTEGKGHTEADEQEARYRELLDAYSEAMEGMALLKGKMTASEPVVEATAAAEGPCSEMSREIQQLCVELDSSLQFTQRAPEPIIDEAPVQCAACALRISELAAADVQIEEMQQQLAETRSAADKHQEECSREQQERLAAEGKVKELQAALRGLRARAKAAGGSTAQQVEGSLKLQLDFGSCNQPVLSRAIERDLAACLPAGNTVKVLTLQAGSVIAQFCVSGDDAAAAFKQLIENPPAEIAGAAVLSLAAAQPRGSVARAAGSVAAREDDEETFSPVVEAQSAASLGSSAPSFIVATSMARAKPSSIGATMKPSSLGATMKFVKRAKSAPRRVKVVVPTDADTAMVRGVLNLVLAAAKAQGVRASELFRQWLVSYQSKLKSEPKAMSATQAMKAAAKQRANILAATEKGGSMPLSELQLALGSMEMKLQPGGHTVGVAIITLVQDRWPALLGMLCSAGASAVAPPKDARITYREWNNAIKATTSFDPANASRTRAPQPSKPRDQQPSERVTKLLTQLCEVLNNHLESRKVRPFDAFVELTSALSPPDWMTGFRETLLKKVSKMHELNWSVEDWQILEGALTLDGEGVLHWKEFKTIFTQYRPMFVKSSKPKPPPAKVALADHPMLWSVFEAIAEWLDGQKDRRAAEVFTTWVTSLDKDRSGFLEFVEFDKGLRQTIPQLAQLPAASMRKVFHSVDTTTIHKVQYKDFAAALQLYGRGYDRAVRIAVRAVSAGQKVIGRDLVEATGSQGPWTMSQFVDALNQMGTHQADLQAIDWQTLWCAAAGGVARFCSADSEETVVGWNDVVNLIVRKESTSKQKAKPAPKSVGGDLEMSAEEEQMAVEVLASLAAYISENGLQLQTLWKRWDRDGNGFIETSELMSTPDDSEGLLQVLRIPGLENREAVKAVLKVLDRDGDQRLNYSELSDAVKLGRRKLMEKVKARQEKTESTKLCKSVFERAARVMADVGGPARRKALYSEFVKADADNSGFLDFEELVAALSGSMQIELNLMEQTAMKDLLESQPQSRLSYKGFEALMIQHATATVLAAVEALSWDLLGAYLNKNRSHMSELLEALDADHDQQLTLIEVARAVMLAGVEKQMAERMASSFPVQATSGLVTFEDFIQTSDNQIALRKIFGSVKAAMGQGSRAVDLFHTWLSKYDRDNSGTFSVDEMCDAIEDATGSGVLTPAEIAHLKREIDADRNGVAGLAEFTAALKKWSPIVAEEAAQLGAAASTEEASPPIGAGVEAATMSERVEAPPEGDAETPTDASGNGQNENFPVVDEQ